MRFFTTGMLVPPGLIVRESPHSQGDFYSEVEDGLYRYVMKYDVSRGIYIGQLMDSKGVVLMSWPLGGAQLTGSVDLLGKNPHANIVLPDGDIIVSFTATDKMMARVSPCGEVKWFKGDYYHHSFDIDNDGLVWTWLGSTSTYSQDQLLVSINPETGEHVEEIDFVEDVLKEDKFAKTMMGLPEYFWDEQIRSYENRASDLFHPNDVEILDEELAEAFPMFNAGDLLISLRNLNYIGVIGREEKKIKWGFMGPWRHQHDPDFLKNGKISVYNNNFLVGPEYEKRTNLLVVDPATNRVINPMSGDYPYFFSETMGKHQWLNEHYVHITIPKEGRFIEVDTRSNQVVYEFNNRAIEGFNAIVPNSYVLTREYFNEDPKTFACNRDV
ncbi:arylsulfotransferase family protein [Marinibactrum halimedae]|uniref:Aryl sulfotransferase n=1 Tax=Marinibactrum halimedae TaxID=1444977 RepID=A0AA37T402_9GAMM|nr:arylsulfotransferase family protein [Marinibactrum halimedae]GLS26280.1 hypothetical protein GCM10007877_19950 [Marinibactrum halimedae]